VRHHRSAAAKLPPTSRSRAAATAADAAAAVAPPPSYVALCRCRAAATAAKLHRAVSLPVETKSHGTDVPSSHAYEYAQKNVTWKDPLFPRRKPSSSSSPRTAK
jgi:hypothetical protein